MLCTILSIVIGWSVAWPLRNGYWIGLAIILFPVFIGLISLLECATDVVLLERRAEGAMWLKRARRSLWAETFVREFEIGQKFNLFVGPTPGSDVGKSISLILQPDENLEPIVLVSDTRRERIRVIGDRVQKFLSDPEVKSLDLSRKESQAAHICVLGCGAVLLYIWFQA